MRARSSHKFKIMVAGSERSDIVDPECLRSHTAGMRIVELLWLLAAASGALTAACWLQVAHRVDAIGAMDQRAYRKSLGRAAVMTAFVLIVASSASALGLIGVD